MSKLPVSVSLKPSYQPEGPAWPVVFTTNLPTPLTHALTIERLMQKQAARMVHNSLLTAGLTARLGDPQVWGEWILLQSAVGQRLRTQQQILGKGCAVLAEDYSELRHANTMSKLMEKQFNLASQLGALISSQATNLVELLENVQVDYGYWASQKVGN